MFSIVDTELPGVLEISTPNFRDPRGLFVKTLQIPAFRQMGLNQSWAEHYWSSSNRNVLRGLHFQVPPHDHTKLVTCVAGIAWDVVVDLRQGAPTYGKHLVRELRPGGIMVYIPRGFAHGFLSLKDQTILLYHVETAYAPASDRGIRWDSCGIVWPDLGDPPTISHRDAEFPRLSEFKSPF
jgi:dTDP-4-dehydrorhamnose 3,5-epimerase